MGLKIVELIVTVSLLTLKDLTYQGRQSVSRPLDFKRSYALFQSEKNALETLQNTYSLVCVCNSLTLSLHETFEPLPVLAPVSGPVNSAIISLNQYSFVVVATPKHIMHVAIQLKCLEVNVECHLFIPLSIAADA